MISLLQILLSLYLLQRVIQRGMVFKIAMRSLYTSKTDTEFLGCIRGFSGIDGYKDNIERDFNNVNKQTVSFSDTEAESHTQGDSVSNLSSIFLQEFYKKIKTAFAPGFENQKFVSDLDVKFYQTN